MRITRAVVPSLFTVLNMFCGFMSVIHSSTGEIRQAAWLIVLAAGFDALDGVMARITKSSSEFGIEIDSLSDIVSFGVAPAFLTYQVYLRELGPPGALLSALVMVFGGLRLARFNVQLVGFDKEQFTGLPIPASAITIASFVLNYWNAPSGLADAAVFLPWMVVALSLLMVSKVKYDTLPKISKRAVRKEPWKFIFFTLAVIVVFARGGSAIFPLLVLFISIGIVRYVWSGVKHMYHSQRKLGDEESVEPTRVDI